MLKTFLTKLVAVALVWLLAVPALAQGPNGLDIARKSKAALEPNMPSTRVLTIDINQGAKRATEWTGVQARASENGVHYMLTVILTPEQAKGMALLAREQDSQSQQMWTYVPAVRRTVTLSPAASFAPLFGSDFTFADLGFTQLTGKYSFLGEEKQGGVETYKLQEIPARNPYYSRILWWIRKADFLPVRRQFFDYAGALSQIEEYGDIQKIDGIPTVTRMKMVLESSGNSTEFSFSHISYHKSAPANLFNPGQLPNLANQPFWNQARE